MSPVSFASINPTNFELTPCRVTYKGVDLGATLGNVKVTIEENISELLSDQLAKTSIDHKTSGMKITIETELAETQLKDNWKVVFPAHKLVTDNLGNKSFYFDSTVGTSLRSLGGALVLHPLSRPDSDKSGDILVYIATAEGKADYTFSPTEQQKMKLVWHMYPDFSTLPPRFLLFGDPAVGLQNAVAGAATAGTGNVGNGTVGSIAVFNGFTETETVSLQCVTAGTGAQFFVSGSQSGPLGLAGLAVTFNSDVIAFLITGGGTPFALNDNFHIATTAANYT
jgi:hypothetical protein